MIDLIEIKGFKGISNEQKVFFSKPNGTNEGSGLNYIVGENCSGKSTIIEAINYANVCKQNQKNGFVSLDDRFSCNNYIMKILYKSDKQSVLIENNEIEENFAKINIESNNSNILNDICYIQSKKYYMDFFAGSSFDNVISQQNNNYVINRKTNENNMYYIINSLVEIGQDKLEKEKFDKFAKENGFDNLKWRLNHKSNDFRNFDIFINNKSYSYNLLYSGDGLITLLYLLIGLYYLQEGKIETLIIDEPEVSLHYQWILLLKKMFSGISKDRQIIIVTHSPIMLDWNAILNGANLIRVFKDENDKSNIRFLTKDSKEYIKCCLEDKFNMHVLEYEGSSIFFSKDKVVLCEGQEDVFGYKKLLKKHNRQEFNFFGWGVGGCAKIRIALKLFDTLGYKKVVAIYDGDQKKEYDEVNNMYKEKYKILKLNKNDIRDKLDKDANVDKEGILDSKFNFKPDYTAGNEDYDYIENMFETIEKYFDSDIIIENSVDVVKETTDKKNIKEGQKENLLTERQISEKIRKSNVVFDLVKPFIFTNGGGCIAKFHNKDNSLDVTYISSFENDVDKLNVVLYLSVSKNGTLIIKKCRLFNKCKTMTFKEKTKILFKALKLRNKRIE